MILWDVESKRSAGRLTGNTESVRALAFSRDGKSLYSGSFEDSLNSWKGGLEKWELDPVALGSICRKRAKRDLSETERDTYISGGDDHKPLRAPPEEKQLPK